MHQPDPPAYCVLTADPDNNMACLVSTNQRFKVCVVDSNLTFWNNQESYIITSKAVTTPSMSPTSNLPYSGGWSFNGTRRHAALCSY